MSDEWSETDEWPLPRYSGSSKVGATFHGAARPATEAGQLRAELQAREQEVPAELRGCGKFRAHRDLRDAGVAEHPLAPCQRCGHVRAAHVGAADTQPEGAGDWEPGRDFANEFVYSTDQTLTQADIKAGRRVKHAVYCNGRVMTDDGPECDCKPTPSAGSKVDTAPEVGRCGTKHPDYPGGGERCTMPPDHPLPHWNSFVGTWLPADTAPEPCPLDAGERPYWMGVDQYDPCKCLLTKGHEPPCVCSHTATADAAPESGEGR